MIASHETSRGLRWAAATALGVLTLLAYAGLRHNGFVDFDDNKYVFGNPRVLAGLDRESLTWAFQAVYDGNWFPLTWLSLMLDTELYGPGPGGYHLTNLLLHLASTLVLLTALTRMTGAPGRSAFVAGIFALHPLHVESVAWIAERKDVLSGFFWMLTLLAWARYAERPGRTRYLAVCVAMALGLLSKATLVTIPFVLLLLDYWPLERLRTGDGHLDRSRLRRALLEKLPLLLLSIAASAMTLLAQRMGGALGFGERLPLAQRLGNAVLSYVAYVAKAFWPTDLIFYYPHPGAALAWPLAAAAAGALLAVTAVLLRISRRHPAPAVGWLWYLGTLVPMIGIVQVGAQGMADRYTYIPLVGLALAVAWGAWAVLGSSRAGRAAAGLGAGVALAACAVVTHAQVAHWRDSFSLYGHALTVTPGNVTVHFELGRSLVNAQRHAEAEPHLRIAARAVPGFFDARANLGVALVGMGRTLEGLIEMRRALELRPEDVQLRLVIARTLAELGRLDEARLELLQLRSLQPALAPVHLLLAGICEELGRTAEAVQHYRNLLLTLPDWADAEAGRDAARRLITLAANQPDAGAAELRFALEAAEILEAREPGSVTPLLEGLRARVRLP